jgi:hypothetical protein
MPTKLTDLYKKYPLPEIEKRLEEINVAINLFQKYYHDKKGISLEFKPDIEVDITIRYFEWLEEFVKPFIRKGNRANAYKVASCTELVIMRFQPIENQGREVNIDFAVFCAMNIIEGIKIPSYFNFDHGRGDLDKKLHSIEEDHRDFLKIWDPSETSAPPIISNAAWWELLHLFFHYRFQAY